MNRGQIVAGIDAGHIDTKAFIVKDREVLGYCKVPTAFDVSSAAQAALDGAVKNADISAGDLAGIVTTGIFREVVQPARLDVLGSVPEYVAAAQGALLLDNDSGMVIDIGGNIHKAVSYDGEGRLLDVIQNDKCADGLGIFYTYIARALGMSEEGLSDAALRSTGQAEVAIQCALSAETDAVDLLCQGAEIPDVAKAIIRFMADRIATMTSSMDLSRKIVAAGGLARSRVLVAQVSAFLGQEVHVLDLPEYIGALGAAVSHEGEK